MAKTRAPKDRKVSTVNFGNQWVADPRQQLFLAYYLDPKSPTFSNALQSALKAGFAQRYAENILDVMPDWLREKMGNIKSSHLLDKAERNLDEMLELPSKVQAMGAFGPIYQKDDHGNKVPIMVHSTGLLKVKADVTKFVAEKIGRGKYAKDEDDAPKTNIINFTQITINAPNGNKNTRDQSNGETISRVASIK